MTQPDNDPKPAVTLSPQDAAALDAALGVPPSGGPADSARVARAHAWLTVLSGAATPQPSPDLLARTLAAVQSERMKLQPSSATQNLKSQISQISNSTPRPWFSRHLADAAAMFIAASLLIAVIIPAVSHARYDYRRTLCATNLSYIKTAMDQYCNLYSHELPSLATADNANWLHPVAASNSGIEGHTNTANLLPLVLGTYIPPSRLICPGRSPPPNAAATITPTDIPDSDYSYVNLFGRYKPTWDGKATTLILADRNPLFTQTPATNPELNSRNHEGHGNYILHADGQVTWEISPDIGPDKDNIWTINNGSQRLLTYTGTETPTTPNDTFLAP